MNRVILIGRLTRDPELRKTTTGAISVCQFRLAVDRSYTAGGEKQTDFINCVAWRNQADNLCKYIRKGGLIAVEGFLQSRTYDDQNGVRRYVLDVVCNTISFLESKKTAGGYDDFSQLEPPATYGYRQTGGSSIRNTVKPEEQTEQETPFADLETDVTGDDLPF